MKRTPVLILSLILLLSSTSCIDLLNEIKINKNRSGSAFIGIESQTVGLLARMAVNELDDSLKSNVFKFPMEATNLIKDIKGVSNVKAFTEIEKGKIGIEFSFVNPRALNRAYYSLADKYTKWYYPNYVKICRNSVKVRNISPYAKMYVEKNPKYFKNNKFIKYLNFKTIVHLPNEVKPKSIKNGISSSDGKTISHSLPLSHVIDNTSKSGLKFRY